jgi:serine/threonine protein kinase
VNTAEPDLDDPRLFQAVQEYMAALESGRKPDRDEFIARHADIAPALSECLAGLELVHTAGPKLREPPPALGGETPTALGDFRIVREIGRGGMGVVYEAIQLSLGRRVALKVLPFAAALDSRQLQRFKNEAQAAAHLHHQHIVPVYAVGVERGMHFYAMQMIEGRNLAAVVEELRRVPSQSGTIHKPSSAPTADLPRRESESRGPAAETRPELGAQFSTMRTQRAGDFYRTIARLVAQAADALDYAHQNGIVHRDIKPANLMVDAGGNLWVTDFGLAQMQADAGLTQSGDLLGTLRYMSPEQAGGPRGLIDHRTDVYSLGATMYELLTLRPIFDGSDRRALLHQIMNEEPRLPRTIDRAIPQDLETIVLKAIGKHPADRYATARELAEDLHRFLRHEPIRARRATAIQRFRKWLRRHPSVPVAASVLLVLLTAASVIGAVLIGNEQAKTRKYYELSLDEQAKTRQAYEQEQQRAKEADERFRLARRAVDDMIKTSEEELADNPHLQGLRKKLLESALAYYEQFINQRSDDPAIQAELAVTRDKVQQMLSDLAELEGTGHLYLLNEPDVLADLEVDDSQRTRLRDLNQLLVEKRLEVFRDFRQQTSEERRTRFLELARANEAGAAAILRADQQVRLRQIAIQSKKLGAFRDPLVTAALKLTPEQQDRIKSIEADTLFAMFSQFGPPGPRGPRGGPPGGPKRGPDEPWRTAIDKVLAGLSDEQRQQWQELIGKPFVRRKGQFRPGGPGGFAPPGAPPERKG